MKDINNLESNALFIDSTVEALMAIDDSQLVNSPNDSGNSLVMATALVHKEHDPSSKVKKQMDSNNNRQQGEAGRDAVTVESTSIIDEVFGEEAGDDRARLTQKDIDDLKAELRKAQEEAKKARLEADEGKRLEPVEETGEILAIIIGNFCQSVKKSSNCASKLYN